MTSLAAAYDSQGDLQRGLPLHREALTLARRLKANYAFVEAAINLLWSLSSMERSAEGIEIAREALALGSYDGTSTLRVNLAYCLRESGQLEETLALYESLIEDGDPTVAGVALSKAIEIHFALSRAEAGRLAISRAWQAFEATDQYIAHACLLAAILQYGTDAEVQRALVYRREQPLDPFLQERLDRFLAERGVEGVSTCGRGT